MKRLEDLDAILKWKGKLVKVVSWAEGKTIFMEEINAKPCNACGHTKEYSALENSPLFQECADPVNTLIP